MSEAVTLRFLGVPKFSVASTPVVCTSKKSLALFAYLMLTRRSHPRHELAALLWGRRDVEASRTSLRVALHRLPAPLAQCLRVDRDSIGVADDAAAVVDVARFESLAAEDALDSLEAAAATYADELLKDFDATASPEFDDWLNAQRVRLAQLAQRVFDAIIARRAERARHDLASAAAERESALATGLRWTSLMPASEAGHRWLMQLYLEMGRRDAALAQYELCQRSLAVTHGRAPSAETRALRQAALAGSEPATATAADAPRSGEAVVRAPVDVQGIASTSFVGRIEELAELAALLADPACRLITLHGLGGSGKTRLAHALVTQAASRFANGVSWVTLEAATSANALPQAIADALGRELRVQGGDAAAAIADTLIGQHRLLVLDNFESMMEVDGDGDSRAGDAIEVVLRILAVAPDVRIVVTSREVLGVQEEWVYEVRGLPHRDHDAIAATAQLPAVELFAQRARQAYLGFSLSAEMPHVMRICALVEGLPLGIELAAAWVRTIPCADIATAIATEAETLVSPHRNRAHRHRNLEAVVACSWNLLRDEQREALAGLGGFVGGFSREAAERVADAPLRALSALCDKSLVRRREEGRYDLHEIVRQFALARLRGSRARHALVSRRHGEYYCDALLALVPQLRSAGEVAADGVLRSEFGNILSAWRRAIDVPAIEIVERMAAPLVAVLHTRGRLTDALAEAERAAALLDKRSRTGVPMHLRLQWGRAAIGTQPVVARRELEAACLHARASAPPAVLARFLYYLGNLEYVNGNLDRAEQLADEALALGGDSEEAEVRMLVHNLRGTLCNVRAQFDRAESLLSSGLEAARATGSPSSIGGMLCSLAVPVYYRGRFADATAMNTEAARLYERLGRNSTATMVRSNLACIAIAQGDIEAALAHARVAVRLSRESGDNQLLSHALVNLGDALSESEDAAGARRAMEETLRLAANEPHTLIDALRVLAELDVRERRFGAALATLLRMRDVLVAHRIDVRVPMLVVAAAHYALAADASRVADARRWLEGVVALDDVDASLKRKSRRLLEQLPAAARRGEDDEVPRLPSSKLEQEVLAFLVGLEAPNP
jgi:predicted ATPase/DNA-binding SARP family transcriptional activator/tetratricopeptide (TPR) repeat protein